MDAIAWKSVLAVIGKVLVWWFSAALTLAGLWCAAVLVGRRAGGKR